MEEHFYLLWPLILIAVITFCRRWLVLITLSFVIISLSLSHYWLKVDADAAFYLLPFRAFEFAIGTLVLFLERKYTRCSKIENLLLLLALATIFIVIYRYDSNTTYPGIYALVPCLAAALMIFSGRASLFGKILSNKFMVGIGLISYSLYLIHWPILVFYKYWVFRALLPSEQIGIFFFSLIVAAGMYRWVEQPFRYSQKNRLSPVTFAGICLALTLVITLPALSAWLDNGWNSRVDNWDELRSVRDETLLPEMQCFPGQIGSNCLFGAKK